MKIQIVLEFEDMLNITIVFVYLIQYVVRVKELFIDDELILK